jgi:hypothetical protein
MYALARIFSSGSEYSYDFPIAVYLILVPIISINFFVLPSSIIGVKVSCGGGDY